MQERKIGTDSSRSHHDFQLENNAVSKLGHRQLGEGTSDKSEDDSDRKHHQPTRWR